MRHTVTENGLHVTCTASKQSTSEVTDGNHHNGKERKHDGVLVSPPTASKVVAPEKRGRNELDTKASYPALSRRSYDHTTCAKGLLSGTLEMLV